MITKIVDLKVSLTDEQNEEVNKLIERFVNEMLGDQQSVSYYNKRRNASKAAEDIFLGKKSEYLALLAMHKEFGFPLVKPDLEIRNGRKKGWEPDLPFREVDSSFPNVHVKACSKFTYDYCKDYSWTFQYSNNTGICGKDDLFLSETEDLVALVYVENSRSKNGVIKSVLPFSEIRKHLKDPIKKTLVGLKKCLYYQDINTL